jgi:tRNA pseudouridine55 synthase
MPIIITKQIGETPLECLERIRKEQNIGVDVPMTYAGRLDPLAEGKMIILVGDECKNKEKYLGLDKTYEIQVLFGMTTDTGDALGLITSVNTEKIVDISENLKLSHYVGKFVQEYPAYSSKTHNGKQLHELARAGELPEVMPTKEVEIFDIKNLGISTLTGYDIYLQVVDNINKVKGDFRQQFILEKWKDFHDKYSKNAFQIITLEVKCSSGTYMRVLAEKMGKDLGVGGLALRIIRNSLGNF